MTALDHPRVPLVDDSDVILDRASTALSQDCDIVVLDISMPGRGSFPS
jgi:hypothetical protein